jgi:hypothetical protein
MNGADATASWQFICYPEVFKLLVYQGWMTAMPDSTQITPADSTHSPGAELFDTKALRDTASTAELSSLELAQALAERLAIAPNDWHRLKSNRNARASEQAAMAIVYLLNQQPEEALVRLQQATGWLDRSISAPPCPTHGTH